MYLHKSPCRYKKKITVLNKNSLPSVDLLGEEASGGGQGPGHGPDAEDGQQHRHPARLGGQRLHDRLQHQELYILHPVGDKQLGTGR